jgi:hypothetical protein
MRGWPSSLVDLKRQLNAHAGDWSLRPENPGSMWPKISLACLHEGKTLTVEQLRSLHALVRRFDARIAEHGWRLPVRQLSAVVYTRRNLHQLLFRTDIPLRTAAPSLSSSSSSSNSSNGNNEPDAASVARVESVLAELTDATVDSYLAHVNRPGGRTNFYVDEPASESTLVAFCASQTVAPADDKENSAVDLARPPSFLCELQSEVDALLPGYYVWFPWSCLHSTIRAL